MGLMGVKRKRARMSEKKRRDGEGERDLEEGGDRVSDKRERNQQILRIRERGSEIDDANDYERENTIDEEMRMWVIERVRERFRKVRENYRVMDIED